MLLVDDDAGDRLSAVLDHVENGEEARGLNKLREAPRFSPLVRYGGAFAPNFKRRDETILNPGQHKRKVPLLLPSGLRFIGIRIA